ncbi:MAG: hypothetical protein AABY11_01410 [archaeon]
MPPRNSTRRSRLLRAYALNAKKELSPAEHRWKSRSLVRDLELIENRKKLGLNSKEAYRSVKIRHSLKGIQELLRAWHIALSIHDARNIRNIYIVTRSFSIRYTLSDLCNDFSHFRRTFPEGPIDWESFARTVYMSLTQRAASAPTSKGQSSSRKSPLSLKDFLFQVTESRFDPFFTIATDYSYKRTKRENGLRRRSYQQLALYSHLQHMLQIPLAYKKIKRVVAAFNQPITSKNLYFFGEDFPGWSNLSREKQETIFRAARLRRLGKRIATISKLPFLNKDNISEIGIAPELHEPLLWMADNMAIVENQEFLARKAIELFASEKS